MNRNEAITAFSEICIGERADRAGRKKYGAVNRILGGYAGRFFLMGRVRKGKRSWSDRDTGHID